MLEPERRHRDLDGERSGIRRKPLPKDSAQLSRIERRRVDAQVGGRTQGAESRPFQADSRQYTLRFDVQRVRTTCLLETAYQFIIRSVQENSPKQRARVQDTALDGFDIPPANIADQTQRARTRFDGRLDQPRRKVVYDLPPHILEDTRGNPFSRPAQAGEQHDGVALKIVGLARRHDFFRPTGMN